MSVKTYLKICLVSMTLSAGALVHAGERDDINQLLKEIQYTKEVVLQLKKLHSSCSAKVCFHYDGLLNQLVAAEFGIKEYLNGDIRSLHTTPQKPLVDSLYRVRKN